MPAVRPMPVFDTHKAVKALCHAGFDDAQAEAVVDQINDAVNDNVATKTDLARFATKEDFERFATKEDLRPFATKDDLQRFATKDDLQRFATKENLELWAAKFATKDDLQPFVTKDYLELWGAKFATKEDLAKQNATMLRYALGIVALAVALTKVFDAIIG